MAGVKKQRMAGSERREQILAIARECFLESGFSGTRTHDIARRAGIAEGMLYRHFDSKEELFERAIFDPVEQWLEHMVETARAMADRPLEERREMSTRGNVELAKLVGEVIPLLGVALFSGAQHGSKFYDVIFSSLFDRMSQNVIGANRPRKTTLSRERARDIAKTVFGVHLMFALDAHFTGEPVDPEKVAAICTEITYDGLFASER